MHNSDVYLENSRSAKPFRTGGHPGFGQGVSAAAREEEQQRVEGMKIAQTAVQSIGMSTRDGWGPPMRSPDYALAVSLIFTKATNHTIMLGTPPNHVVSTSILWASLLHDKRFEQVPMSAASPGDIIIGSGWQQGADGYAGFVVDYGRIISNGSQGVQDNSSLAELQRSHPGMVLFRYVGFRNFYRSRQLANAGYNPDESRVPAGQPGGGQWTTGSAGAKAQRPQIAFGGRQATETEAVKALRAAVTESIKAGGQHPTRAQLEQFSEAFDALQKYLVDHGMTPEEAFEAVYNAVHNLTHPGSGPNPGSEGVLGTYLGKPAGADIAQIFATAILGRSNVPDKGADSKPPDGGADSQSPGEPTDEPKSGSDQQGSTTRGKKPDYSTVPDPKNVKSGGDFSAQQKEGALRVNREANGGEVRSDGDGRVLVPPEKSQKGVKPSPNEWQFDHKDPKVSGGTNASSNIQILSREENRAKSAQTPSTNKP